MSTYAFPMDSYKHIGLTKRELFAALAMQGAIACGEIGADMIAQNAIARADALIKALAANGNHEVSE